MISHPPRRLTLNLTTITLLALASAAYAQTPSLATLRPAHPRLILLDSDIPAIKATIAADPFAAATFAELQKAGDAFLNKKPYPYTIGGPEKNLLSTARDVENVIVTTAGLYRLTGQRKYADRALAEMLNAAAYPDWFPSHFLDTAELTAALGIGYDWLYPILTPQQRDTLHAALVHKGLDPWLAELAGTGVSINGKPPKPFDRTNNWVQVCTGGETLGALALAQEEPTRAQKILSDSQPRMKKIMEKFAPDGGFEEGPTYWSYATIYNVLYLAALQSALGTDFGIAQMPGFAETGGYRLQALGPTFLTANFGDAHDPIYRAPQMFWMATHLHHPDYATAERRIDEAFAKAPEKDRNNGEGGRFLLFTLVWYQPPTTAADPATVASFERTGQAFLRSNWSKPDGSTDPNALYIALKGGSAKASHGHLDLGSFVLDDLGERWALDLGAETYAVPQYFGKLRWTYFRTRTESHNTLTLDNANEDLDADAPITAIGQTTAQNFAVLDLTSTYKSQLKSWHRGAEILDNRLLLQDEITPKSATDLRWRILTRASIKLDADPANATLTLNGKHLRAQILSPAGAQFETRTIPSPTPPQNPITGVFELSIHQPTLSKPETLTILFTPDHDKSPAPTLIPLAKWDTTHP